MLFFSHTQLRRWWPTSVIAATVITWLLAKILTISFRFGDTTAYWYMAQQLASGVVPYRDFFFADPPMQLLVLTPLYLLFSQQLLVLQTLPWLYESITAVLLASILHRSRVRLYWLAPLIYLGSFTITATADYGTGLQLGTVLTLLGYYSLQRSRNWLAGVFFAAAVLTKLYFLPAIGAIVLALIVQKKLAQARASSRSCVWRGCNCNSGIFALFWSSRHYIFC